LLVEDEELVRNVTSSMLRERGFEVIEASDGVEALAKLEECHAEIHLVLTDVVMPRMKGTELAEQIHEKYPSIKVLLMSGYQGDASAEDAEKELALPLLPKPFSDEQLTARLRQVLD
jgi:two-component system cell cycle sensor histidine kinase/response regulator CckA